jgi:hypothetical protein
MRGRKNALEDEKCMELQCRLFLIMLGQSARVEYLLSATLELPAKETL